MAANDDEDELLRSVAMQNAQAILLARQRAEEELVNAKEALESKTRELAHSLAMMKATLESTTDGILVTNGDRKVTNFNEKFARMWRIPHEIMDTGDHQSLVEFTCQFLKQPQPFLDRIDGVYASSPPETFDVLELTDGRVFERYSRIQFVDGRDVGRVWSFRDITERRNVEDALRKQSEWLRVTLHSIGDAVITTDIEARISSLNPVAMSLTGWLQEEAQGQPLETVFRVINEQSREPIENPVVRVLNEGRYVGLANHTLLISRDGTERPIDESAAPIRGSTGETIGVVLIFRDVTEQRQAEREVRQSEARKGAILETAIDCIITCDQHGNVVEFNPAAEQTFGYSRANVIGRELADLIIPHRLRERHRIGMKHYMATGEGPILNRRIEMQAQRSDGTEFPVELAITSTTSDSTPEFTAYLRDITDRKTRDRRRAARLSVAQILAENAAVEETAPRLLKSVCDAMEWDVGTLWIVNTESNFLHCVGVWHSDSFPHSNLAATCRNMLFAPDVGLPGQVWLRGIPDWIPDIAQDESSPLMSIAKQEGLHAAIGGPIMLGNVVLGVIVFFSREIRKPDADLWEMLTTIGGQVGHFIGRGRAQDALQESETQFRQLANALPQIVWTARPDGFVDYFNERWYEYSGFPRDEFGDQSWKPILHPDDVERSLETYYSSIRSGNLFQIEYRFKDRRIGGYRWFLGRAYPVRDEHGRIVRWFGTCTDIDDTKRSEVSTRFLADSSAALAKLTDSESTLQQVARMAVPFFADWCAIDMQLEDGAVQRLAVNHSDPAKLRLLQELIRRYPPRADASQGVMNVLRSGQSEWLPLIPDALLAQAAQDEEHLALIRQLGLKSYICVPLRSRGRTIGALTFATSESGRIYDTTDLAAAEDLADRAAIAIENASLMSALKESDRRKDEFLAMLAHELRNPLAPIRNAAQIIRGKSSPMPELRWATDVIDRQVNQLTRLVDDLLEVSRITRGKIELRKERVDLAEVVSGAIEAARPLIDEHAHQLTISMPKRPIHLDADPTRLTQVILNLLNNAAKYTDQGGRIGLTVELLNGFVIMKVTDNGIGISNEMLPRVFDMFTQVEGSLERSRGGLGIGLTLVQQLVAMHGGAVEARSEGLGKGSEFVVRLPLPVNGNGFSEMQVDEQIAIATTGRVLIVDDNRDAADSLGMLLRFQGFDVQTVHDGMEAVAAAQAFQPDVVLLDIGLPKLNGYDAARQIRHQSGNTKVVLVAITGWGHQEDRRRSAEAGFDHHLTKPVDFSTLQKLLAEHNLIRPA